MNQGFVRLLKADGHLGALYDPKRNVMRFISRDGGVTEYDLTVIAEKQRQKEAKQAATSS